MYCVFVVRLITSEIKGYNHIPINNKYFLFALNIEIFHSKIYIVKYINLYPFLSSIELWYLKNKYSDACYSYRQIVFLQEVSVTIWVMNFRTWEEILLVKCKKNDNRTCKRSQNDLLYFTMNSSLKMCETKHTVGVLKIKPWRLSFLKLTEISLLIPLYQDNWSGLGLLQTLLQLGPYHWFFFSGSYQI